MFQDTVDKLTSHETNAVREVLNAIAPKGEWTGVSIEFVRELQVKLNRDNVKTLSNEVVDRLQDRHPHLTKSEIIYLCVQHCLNYVALEKDKLPY